MERMMFIKEEAILKSMRYLVVRTSEMEVICATNDLGGAIDFVRAQEANENMELTIFERLQRKDWAKEPEEAEKE